MGFIILRFHSLTLGESPPPALKNCFGRDQLVEKIVGLAENLEPIALIGAGGIGKTSIALAVLHYDRIKQRFGENRRFIRCDQFPASRAHLLSRISEVIGAGAGNPKDLTCLRPLLSSKEMIIVLDNAESILDPKVTSAEDTYSVVDELCKIKTICVCITSRITIVPPRCKRPEIPTLSMEAACDIFYSIYGDGGRSNIISDLLRRLDFQILSITLLAATAHHNGWDYNRLAEGWDAQRAQVLQTNFNQSLTATIKLSLSSPIFCSLSPNTRDLLGVIAFFPQGIDEKNIARFFLTIANPKNIFTKLCALSLTYRSNGFVTMLAPIRDYFRPTDPRSSPLLRAARDYYFRRLSLDVDPGIPGFGEARWIVSEDVNVEHLLDTFTSLDRNGGDVWEVCYFFMQHLVWHKPRPTILGPKLETLPDNHRYKPRYLFELSRLLGQVGNRAGQKQLLLRILELWRGRGNDSGIAQTLRYLSYVNRYLRLYEEGIGQANEAVEISERIGDAGEQTQSLTQLAWLLFRNGQLDAAENAASRAVDLIQETGIELHLCQLLRVLGNIYGSKGEKQKAIHHLETASLIATPFDWHDSLFWNNHDLAELFLNEREFENALTHIEKAKTYAAEDPYKLGRTMLLQASIWHQQRRLEDAKSEAIHALTIFEASGAADEAQDCRKLLQRVKRARKKQSH